MLSGKDINDIDIEEFVRITENITRKKEEIYRESLFADTEIVPSDDNVGFWNSLSIIRVF
jgi:hypothetical protein